MTATLGRLARRVRAGAAADHDGGFTVIEVVVAFMLFAIVGTAATTAVVDATKSSHGTQQRVQAADVAQQDIAQSIAAYQAGTLPKSTDLYRTAGRGPSPCSAPSPSSAPQRSCSVRQRLLGPRRGLAPSRAAASSRRATRWSHVDPPARTPASPVHDNRRRRRHAHRSRRRDGACRPSSARPPSLFFTAANDSAASSLDRSVSSAQARTACSRGRPTSAFGRTGCRQPEPPLRVDHAPRRRCSTQTSATAAARRWPARRGWCGCATTRRRRSWSRNSSPRRGSSYSATPTVCRILATNVTGLTFSGYTSSIGRQRLRRLARAERFGLPEPERLGVADRCGRECRARQGHQCRDLGQRDRHQGAALADLLRRSRPFPPWWGHDVRCRAPPPRARDDDEGFALVYVMMIITIITVLVGSVAGRHSEQRRAAQCRPRTSRRRTPRRRAACRRSSRGSTRTARAARAPPSRPATRRRHRLVRVGHDLQLRRLHVQLHLDGAADRRQHVLPRHGDRDGGQRRHHAEPHAHRRPRRRRVDELPRLQRVHAVRDAGARRDGAAVPEPHHPAEQHSACRRGRGVRAAARQQRHLDRREHSGRRRVGEDVQRAVPRHQRPAQLPADRWQRLRRLVRVRQPQRHRGHRAISPARSASARPRSCSRRPARANGSGGYYSRDALLVSNSNPGGTGGPLLNQPVYTGYQGSDDPGGIAGQNYRSFTLDRLQPAGRWRAGRRVHLPEPELRELRADRHRGQPVGRRHAARASTPVPPASGSTRTAPRRSPARSRRPRRRAARPAATRRR